MLLLELTFGFNVLLLELGDQVVLQFHLLEAAVVASIGLRPLDTILVLVVLESSNQLMKLSYLVLIASDFVLQFLELVFQGLNRADLLFAFLLRCGDILVEQVSLPLLLLDLFPVLVDRFLLGLISICYNLQVRLDLFLYDVVVVLLLLSLFHFSYIFLVDPFVLDVQLIKFVDLIHNGIQLDLFLLQLIGLIRL